LLNLSSFSLCCANPSLDSAADASQSEVGGVEAGYVDPEAGRGIIGGVGDGGRRHVDGIEQVERVERHAGIEVEIGEREEIAKVGRGDGEARLLADLATDALLARLLHIDESARKVERAACRFVSAAYDEELAAAVHLTRDEGRGGRHRVGIVGEAAVGAVLALDVVDTETAAAAVRAEQEVVEGMHNLYGLNWNDGNGLLKEIGSFH